MIGGYKVVGVIPAGRKRYMDILVPYVMDEAGLIDEVQVWENTSDPDDLEYLGELCNSRQNYFTLVKLSEPHLHLSGVERVPLIRHFFKGCIDPQAIYVRFDDDICWMQSGAVRTLLEFRLAHPDFFLVYPAIINNGRTAYIHQIMGHLPPGLIGNFDEANLIHADPAIAQVIHQRFLSTLGAGEENSLKYGKYIIDNFEKVPINCIAWFGSEFAKFGGVVADDPVSNEQEEYWLTKIKPKELGKPNAICGQSLMAHFAFHNQRAHMELNTSYLDVYGAMVHCRKSGDYSFLAG